MLLATNSLNPLEDAEKHVNARTAVSRHTINQLRIVIKRSALQALTDGCNSRGASRGTLETRVTRVLSEKLRAKVFFL